MSKEKKKKYKSIATPTLSTYNANGYSSRPINANGHERQRKTKRNLEALGHCSDGIFTQETKTTQDAPFYDNLLRNFVRFSNPNPSSDVKGGTDIFIKRDLVSSMAPTHHVIIPGYVQAVSLAPRDEHSAYTASFTMLNVYLPVGEWVNGRTNEAERISVIEALTSMTIKSNYLFMGGDWNFVEDSSDTAGDKHYSSTKRLLDSFKLLLTKHQLEEVYQPLHTRVKGTQSSRLDRWYISHPTPIKCCMQPEASIPQHPHVPGQGKSKGPSDHFPVRLSFHQPNLSAGVRYKIPTFVANHPAYHEQVRADYKSVQPTGHPVKDWLCFKKICKEAAHKVQKSLGSQAAQLATSLTRSIGTFRKLKAGTPFCVVAQGAKGDAKLEKAIMEDHTQSPTSLANLQKHIQSTLTMSPMVDPRTGSARSFLREVKSNLAVERKHLTHLYHEGKALDDAEKMASLLKETWSPIWNKPDPEDTQINTYLGTYDKRILSHPKDFTLDMVQQTMLKPRDCACGPDGLPFNIYRHLVDLAAPLLYNYIQYLSQGNRPNNSFNFANLFFLPKDDSRLPTAIRPISVVNTDNRLVANVVRAGLTPVLVPILNKTQKAFIAGEDIEGLVAHFNNDFYNALQRQKPRHQFFHDWKKAYDSVSRRYLLTLLARVGVPSTYINIIALLFEKNKAFPIMTDPHKITISMTSGLRQGCPLSPILFLLALDPLLTALESVPNIEKGAWCDDLAVAFSEWKVVPSFLEKIDAYNQASGSSSNVAKSLFISTTDTTVPMNILPSTWATAHIVESYKHLGVLRGPNISVVDIFAEAMAKLRARVAYYMPFKSLYSLQHRVIISNAFLTPILSYLCQFFLLANTDIKEVKR